MIDEILKECESTGLFLDEAPLRVDSTNIFGDTPLHLVCRWGDAEAVAALLAAGATVNSRGDKGQTPLFCTESTQVVDLLLAAGADPTIKDEFGETAESFLRSVGQRKVADHIGTRTKKY
jgi:ankyrin repeat protein